MDMPLRTPVRETASVEYELLENPGEPGPASNRVLVKKNARRIELEQAWSYDLLL